jgi:hypothetical protein
MSDLSGWERETVVNLCEAEPDTVSVWTAQRSVGRWLEKVTERLGIPMERTSRPTWSATLPKSCVLFRLPPKPRQLTEAQKAAMGERLAKAREARKST